MCGCFRLSMRRVPVRRLCPDATLMPPMLTYDLGLFEWPPLLYVPFRLTLLSLRSSLGYSMVALSSPKLATICGELILLNLPLTVALNPTSPELRTTGFSCVASVKYCKALATSILSPRRVRSTKVSLPIRTVPATPMLMPFDDSWPLRMSSVSLVAVRSILMRVGASGTISMPLATNHCSAMAPLVLIW